MITTRTLSGFLLLALLGASFSTGTESGQDTKGRSSSWDNIKSLTPGQEIRVEMKNDRSYHGEFESLSNDGITLRQPAGEQVLARQDILRVSEKNGQKHRARNVAVGAAVGAGLGLVIGLAADHVILSHPNCTGYPCGYQPHPARVITGALAVGGFGAAIGAVVPTGGWRDIYRAQ